MNFQQGIFTSEVLEEVPVIHGFTAREKGNLGFGRNPGDPDVVSNRHSLFESLGAGQRRHVQPRQQHTDRVIQAREFVPGIEADAVISSDSKDLLSVLTADCIPILVYHPHGIVATIHAGWRGLYNEIIKKTLRRIPEGALAVAGPSIGPCCYEVDVDLAAEFGARFGERVVIRSESSKPHLDLRAVAIQQLENAAIEEMEISQLCTFCHPELFFSYRRDGSSGRLMAFIGLQETKLQSSR